MIGVVVEQSHGQADQIVEVGIAEQMLTASDGTAQFDALMLDGDGIVVSEATAAVEDVFDRRQRLGDAAIAVLVRKRGSRAATIAALIGGIGAFCGAIVNVFVGINLAAAATAHVTREAAARILVSNFNSGPGQAFTDFYAFSESFAPIIMGIALWQSRHVPRWLAVLFAVGFELAEQTASVGIARVALQMAPFAVAMVLLSVRIWQAATDRVVPNHALTLADDQ